MARSHTTNITSMPQSVEDERHARMVRYVLMMGIRTACFLALIWVRGPWMLVFAAGAIFLPWFAVIIANAVRSRRRDDVERPDAIPRVLSPSEWSDPDHRTEFDSGARTATERTAPGSGPHQHPAHGDAQNRRAS